MHSQEISVRFGKPALPQHGPDWILWGLLALALLVRVAAIVAFPSLHHPDENFQLFEQAHRMAFGYGIVPWEFIIGIRSPVLPAILAGIFRLAEPLVGGPQGYLFVARLVLALSSLAAVAAVYQMGRRTSATHALIAGLVAATWFELVYFADRPLTGAVATTVLLVGLSLASVPADELTPRRLFAIGFSLALCLMLRIQLATGLLVVALWVGRLEFRKHWLPMALGGLVPLAVFGVADWIVWGGFFHSFLQAFRANVTYDAASVFGTAPPGAYARWFLVQWRYAFPLLWILVIVRARSSAMWIVVALAIVLTHSLIAHKEYRFVFPAFACLVVVAALGSADLVERARRLLRPVIWRGLIVVTALLWVGTSAALAFTGPFRDQWFKARGVILSSFALAKKPDLCGVLFYDAYWFDTGGYSFLHRDVPLYAFDHHAAPAHIIRSTASFDAIVLKRSSIADFADRFRLQQCFAAPNSADVCVMVRDGPCRHELAMNAFLAPHMSLPGAVQSTNPAWTTDVPGRVWHEKDNSGPSAWIRRGDSNVFDVAGCVNRFCGGKALSILRSGSEVMVLRPGLGKANDVVYLGIMSGTHVSGWFPGGPWTADFAD